MLLMSVRGMLGKHESPKILSSPSIEVVPLTLNTPKFSLGIGKSRAWTLPLRITPRLSTVRLHGVAPGTSSFIRTKEDYIGSHV